LVYEDTSKQNKDTHSCGIMSITNSLFPQNMNFKSPMINRLSIDDIHMSKSSYLPCIKRDDDVRRLKKT